MSTDRFTAFDTYLDRMVVGEDPAAHAARADGLPEIEVTPTQGKLLYLLAQIHCARSILEIGTLGGYSTIWLGRALPPDGRLVTIEVDPGHAEVARANIEEGRVDDVVELLVGDALEWLPRIEGPFDLIFIDADKRSNPEYLEHAIRLSRSGSLIVADNVVRDGAVADPDTDDPSAAGVHRFFEMIRDDPRIDATAVQTVGAKGWDGFALILVR